MSNDHYNSDQLMEALKSLGIQKGDVLFSHSNLGFFGRMQDVESAEGQCRKFLAVILATIGHQGTLVVPTFTYSFPKNKIFDPVNSKSDCGFFAEYIRQQPTAKRSLDPCISVAAIGKLANELTESMPKNAYGQDCFFERFLEVNGKICNLNFDAGSTLIHYVERQLKVPYRFDKNFYGSILLKDQDPQEAESTLWVRYLHPSLEANFEAFDRIAKQQKKFIQTKLGRGSIGVITARDTFNLIETQIKQTPLFLTKAINTNPHLKPEEYQCLT